MAVEKRVPTDAEIRARIPGAIAAAQQADRSEPRAAAASYDRTSGRVRIDLTNGCVFEFPAAMAQGLADAGADDLVQVEVYPGGDGARERQARRAAPQPAAPQAARAELRRLNDVPAA
jgi:hypothetical protein